MPTRTILTAALLSASALLGGLSPEVQAQDKSAEKTQPAVVIPVAVENFRARRERSLLRRRRQEGRSRQVRARPRADADRQADGHPHEPRHALFVGGVRPRRGAGDGHAARRRQALHVDAGRSTRTSTRPRSSTRAGSYTYTQEQVGTRYVVLGDPHARRSRRIRRMSKRCTRCRTRSRSSRRAREASRCRTGIRPARRRCATRSWRSARRCPTPSAMFGPKDEVDPVRHLIGDRDRLGRQSRTRTRCTSACTPTQERRQDGPPAHGQGRAGRWLLVDQRLQRQGLLRAERARTRTRSTTSPRRRTTTGSGRHPVRPAATARPRTALPDRAGLRVHGAPLPPAEGGPRRDLEVPAGAAGGASPGC